MNFGPTELLIVLAIFTLLFGAARLPKLARSVGESAREFKDATTAINRVDESRPDLSRATSQGAG